MDWGSELFVTIIYFLVCVTYLGAFYGTWEVADRVALVMGMLAPAYCLFIVEEML